MYVLYSLLLLKTLILLFPYYFFKRTILRGESLNIRKRLGYGLPQAQNKRKSIWIHAVSVGEVLSLQRLIQQLKEKHSSWVINFSSLTSTGLRMANEKLQGVDNVFLIPLDFARSIRKFFNAFNPKLFILAESEFWPNLLRVAKEQDAAVLLINGRISDHSFRRYRRFRFFSKKILKNIDLSLVQTEKEKEKLEEIGMNYHRVRVVGNLKAEIELPLFAESEILRLKKDLNIQEGKKVIVAGSTRKGEEEKLLRAFSKATKVRGNLQLVLAPRHPVRVNEVERICQNFPFSVKRRTELSSKKKWEILILDTIGELAQFYALSDVAFVGGSLVPWGGHNILEPAFYAKPVFFGPHMHNFEFLAEKFVQSGGARIIHEEKDLVELFLNVGDKALIEMGKAAKETLGSLQGATERTIEAIEAMMR